MAVQLRITADGVVVRFTGSDRVWVSDASNRRVAAMTRKGVLLDVLDAVTWASPAGACTTAGGDMLIAECTDPLTAIDIPNLLRETGDTMVSSAREGDVLVFRIRKS